MKIIETLEGLIEKYTESYNIAEVQLMNGYYPHNWHSEKVKECFLKGIKYIPEDDEDEDLPF